jgi:hypothetical protein
MLSADMEASDTLGYGGTLLDIACEDRFVRLVEVLLARGDQKCTHEQSVQNITDSLHSLLKRTSYSKVKLDTKAKEHVKQIVTMLADHGAKIDEKIRGSTVRQVMSRHPFLRRYLLPDASTN